MALQMLIAVLMLFVGIRGIRRHQSDRVTQVCWGLFVLVGSALVIEGLWPH